MFVEKCIICIMTSRSTEASYDMVSYWLQLRGKKAGSSDEEVTDREEVFLKTCCAAICGIFNSHGCRPQMINVVS